jgi:type IV pilus assembly protein PilV
MVVRSIPFSPHKLRGATMIEVLVTLVVVALGLFGLAGLQMRLQVAEMEAYQRSQALLLLSDMANRISTNRNNAASYITATGVGATCSTTVTSTAQRDLSEWCNALQGAGETTNSGTNKVGVMVGGRGCVETNGGDYLVTIAWQGLTPIDAPPSSVTCGANQYNLANTKCVNDLCRRTVTTLVRIANLTSP